jgi:hypothetical protein
MGEEPGSFSEANSNHIDEPGVQYFVLLVRLFHWNVVTYNREIILLFPIISLRCQLKIAMFWYLMSEL